MKTDLRELAARLKAMLPTLDGSIPIETSQIKGLECGRNLERDRQAISRVERLYEKMVLERLGLPMKGRHNGDGAKRTTVARLEAQGFVSQFGGISIHRNGLSPGCVLCMAGYGLTVSHSEKCTRRCFYCYQERTGAAKTCSVPFRVLEKQIESAHRSGVLSNFAVTGGEPLIDVDRVCRCFDLVKQMTGGACETRLYTNGDLVTEEVLKRLRDCGLKEVRFGFNCGDIHYDRVELAKRYIPRVMVEMPVFPVAEQAVRGVLDRLDEIGVFGINIKELNYPGHNPEAFRARGYKIKHQTLMPIWFGGLLPLYAVAGSEEVCLRLLEYTARRGLRLSVHYCSIENKRHVYQMALQRHSEYVKKPYEAVGEDGLLQAVGVYGQAREQALVDLQEKAVPPEQIHFSKKGGLLLTHPENMGFLTSKGYPVAMLRYTPTSNAIVKIEAL